jgi:hypothetical protein
VPRAIDEGNVTEKAVSTGTAFSFTRRVVFFVTSERFVTTGARTFFRVTLVNLNKAYKYLK